MNIARNGVIEWVQAGPDGDTVKGNDADNYLSGASGGDTLVGRRGNEYLLGDVVAFGNNGKDILKGVRAETPSTEAWATTPSSPGTVRRTRSPAETAATWSTPTTSIAYRRIAPRG